MRMARMKGLVLAAAAVLGCAGAVAPVSAETAAGGVVNLNGVYSPALPLVGGSVTFTATGTFSGVVGGDVVVGGFCSLSGVETGGLAEGSGSYTATCSGSASVSVTASFVRVGTTVVASGTLSDGSSYAAVCVWIPSSVPNPTGYHEVCVWV